MDELYVIGIGPMGLDEVAKGIVSSYDVVIASERLLDRVKKEGLRVKSFFSISPLKDALDFIRVNMGRKRMVVLAGGDPLFFGIGRKLLKEFGKERVKFIPAVSSMQLAFAKIKEPWDDVFFVSVHGRDVGEIVADVNKHEKVCILTDDRNTPGRIAKILLEAGLDYNVFVCENMGMQGERVSEGDLSAVSKEAYSDLNLMILIKPMQADHPDPVFGLSESEITHARGLITKDEVRAVTLHKLRIPHDGILWDIGSGSGSVAIEAARMNPGIKVYAVEKEEGHISKVRENKRRYSAHNIEIVHGEAPEALSDLPRPDRVFIGGSGGMLEGILREVCKNLKGDGRVVINAATIDTLTLGMKLLEAMGFTLDVVEVSVTRTKRLKGRDHLSALNPVFIIVGER